MRVDMGPAKTEIHARSAFRSVVEANGVPNLLTHQRLRLRIGVAVRQIHNDAPSRTCRSREGQTLRISVLGTSGVVVLHVDFAERSTRVAVQPCSNIGRLNIARVGVVKRRMELAGEIALTERHDVVRAGFESSEIRRFRGHSLDAYHRYRQSYRQTESDQLDPGSQSVLSSWVRRLCSSKF